MGKALSPPSALGGLPRHVSSGPWPPERVNVSTVSHRFEPFSTSYVPSPDLLLQEGPLAPTPTGDVNDDQTAWRTESRRGPSLLHQVHLMKTICLIRSRMSVLQDG